MNGVFEKPNGGRNIRNLREKILKFLVKDHRSKRQCLLSEVSSVPSHFWLFKYEEENHLGSLLSNILGKNTQRDSNRMFLRLCQFGVHYFPILSQIQPNLINCSCDFKVSYFPMFSGNFTTFQYSREVYSTRHKSNVLETSLLIKTGSS